ncbi:hypothetical protein Klosneuvirus_6_79 [Klosneuvirus KNV1]|uniref:Uncharacterized protein n=1 Tax=Klosneuvirus KNV1 TaxID=1977640 RepID=A0A1V0SLA6_9VIRU|nr:hypothetical protein Klosneuvirus_6_79 [Klosneuvirus KNV1]
MVEFYIISLFKNKYKKSIVKRKDYKLTSLRSSPRRSTLARCRGQERRRWGRVESSGTAEDPTAKQIFAG